MPDDLPAPTEVGRSRAGRPVPAWVMGKGPIRVSLIAGNHADEPVGTRFLRKLLAFLAGHPDAGQWLERFTWLIIPHVNPDGAEANRGWTDAPEAFSLPRYLAHVYREPPADDVEFGYPVLGLQGAKRPENAFVYDCWRKFGPTFHLHASLHSMAISFGAWFLLEPTWIERTAPLRQACAEQVRQLGYPLLKLDRGGEKGFFFVAPGFGTRPNFRSMRDYFLAREDAKQAAHFHPSSMDSIRSLGGDCLTLVSELPHFLLPPVDQKAAWPDPGYRQWKDRLDRWKAELKLGRKLPEEVARSAHDLGLRPMPIRDHMALQWGMIRHGLQMVGDPSPG